MTTKTILSTAALAAALTTASAAVADAPITFKPGAKVLVIKDTARTGSVVFRTTAPLPRRANGGVDANLRSPAGVASIGTYKKTVANSYTSPIRSAKAFKDGAKVKVTLQVAGQSARTATATVVKAGTAYTG